MVQKDKEDLCNWFKDLIPRKRIDYMCGLLHLCLPVELRFIGTVLEDIAKKDFNYLRDAENRANNPSEWSTDGSQSPMCPKFRAKIQINLALMHSADGSCADILFEILEKQFSNLTNYVHDNQVLDDVLTILTVACHHPAFKIKQRLRLGEILKNAEDHCRDLWEDPPFPKHLTPSNRPTKDITSIFVNGIRGEVQNKKAGPDYEIHTSWSNGEVTQHFMKHKELQTLHHQIFNKFPEEKRLQHLFPSVLAQRRSRHESKEEKISSINTYFSELSKAQHILGCNILTRFFQNGKLITGPVQMSPSLSPSVYYPSYENRFYGHFPESYRLCYSQPPGVNMMTAVQPTVLSSATTSPSNSRSSSPSVTINNNNNNNKNTRNVPSDAGRGTVLSDKSTVDLGKPKAGGLQHQALVDAHVETVQLLKLLDMEEHKKKLSHYTPCQLRLMGSEELAKLGLPQDAIIKLQSSLDPQKHSLQDMNGVIQVQQAVPGSNKQERVMHSFPLTTWQGHGSHTNMPPPSLDPASVQQQQLNPPPPPLQPQPYPSIHQYHLVSPPNAMPSPLHAGTDNSPCPSEQCTPSLSPSVISLPDSPPSSLASPTSVYLEDKSAKNHQQIDSSGSEEDKVRGQSLEGNESGPYRGNGKGPNRPQQSISLPLLNSNAVSPSGIPEKGKAMGVPASISAPVVTNEATTMVVREAGTPPMVPGVINGFGGSETTTSFLPHHIFMSLSALQQQQQPHQLPFHRYKSAQPTHMGPRMHKNVVNMPCLDMNSQPPPPAPSINKNPIMLHHHHHPHHHNYIIQQNSNMIHPPQPQASNNNVGSPQQLPPGQVLMPPGLNAADNTGNMAGPPFMQTLVPTGSSYMHPHAVMTSMSNSSTTPTQPSGQQPPPPPQQQQQPAAASASHSPSPVTHNTPVQPDQIQQAVASPTATYTILTNPNTIGDGLIEGRQHKDSNPSIPTPTNTNNTSANKPTNNNNNNNSNPPTPNVVATTNNGTLQHIPNMTSGPGSGTATPSPPLHQPPPPPPKQMVVTGDGANHPQQHQTMYGHPPPLYAIPTAGNVSVSMPPFSNNPHHQQNTIQQHFPNGIIPEVYLQAARFQVPSQLPHVFYGSQAFNPNPHIHHNNNNNGNNNNHNNSGISHQKPGGKNSCYNCGSSAHKASDCKESPMDSMTKSYRLNIKPKSDSD